MDPDHRDSEDTKGYKKQLLSSTHLIENVFDIWNKWKYLETSLSPR